MPVFRIIQADFKTIEKKYLKLESFSHRAVSEIKKVK